MAIEHHLQKEILRKLVLSDTARFADLKPSDVDSNIFTYHLQQLIKQKYVEKLDDGSYTLTATGKAAGISSNLTAKEQLWQAHSVIFLAITDSNGNWLLRRRLVQPVYGKWGFIHGEPSAHEPIRETAEQLCNRKTGLNIQFEPCGAGYIRIFHEDELESFTHFTLLKATVSQQDIVTNDETGENAWVNNPDFSSADMIPSMAVLSTLMQQPDFFFAELTYTI